MAQQTEQATVGVWQADPYHTQVAFSAKHLGMMTVRGLFHEVSVTGTIDPYAPEKTAIEVTVQIASIRTHHQQRDKDILSSNFLGAETYPTMTFKSTKVEHGAGDNYTLTGDLTIKGVTHPVTFNMTMLGEFSDPHMGHRFGYSGEGKINRKDFDMSFSPMLDGKLIVSDEVQISLEGEVVEKPAGA
jgi:polyisoprenoid-binding protein YceI